MNCLTILTKWAISITKTIWSEIVGQGKKRIHKKMTLFSFFRLSLDKAEPLDQYHI